MSDIINAIICNGLEIERIDEYNTEMANLERIKNMEKFPLSYIISCRKIGFEPDRIIASSEKNNVSASGSISLIPTWGIRRNLGKHFEYEMGIGVGYQF